MSQGGSPELRFDDGKDAQALRTIGEVANALGLRQHVLRYWEQQFPMLQPLKRSGGRRYYRPEDVALLQTIDRLVNREGYTLKGARQALAGGVVQASPEPPTIGIEDILPHLRAIRARLARALEAA
jgi:DNA-binding transcriptional MerR regulator